MFRNTMPKLEKTKVRVEFRLQFHATHIPQTGWNNLFVSVIPSDSSKATAKTNKANVRNRSCVWADPIYETTRLIQDPKTNHFEEKIYKLFVAMGTSRSSLLGEANINLSDYLDSSKPSVVALPLHGSNSGAILHVSVQLLTSKTGFREFEPLREVNDRGLSANTEHDGRKLSTLKKAMMSLADKVDTRRRFKPNPKEIPSLEAESGLREGYFNSTADNDESSDTSGSLCAEKRFKSRTQEIDSIKSNSSGDMGWGLPSESPTHGTRNSVHQWDRQTYVNREMAIVYEENSRLKRVLEEANISIDELRKEIANLQDFALSSEQNLAKEVSVIKAECSRFKNDLEIVRNIKTSAKMVDESKAERENLVRKMGQMECYYEATIEELEETQKKILDELQDLRHEHSSCIYSVSSAEAQMEVVRQQLNSERLHNKELEKRAATSEAALRRARMNYSVSVNQLQKDLGALSLQVLSMYETNGNLVGKTLDLKSSVGSQDDLYEKMKEEVSEMLLVNINLDVYSVMLHEALLEASLDSRTEMHELTEQLELSCRSNRYLRLKLQKMSDEICTLKEEKAVSISRSNDLALENQTLEVKLRSVSDEKRVLSERIGELESLLAENIKCKSIYESCEVEKARIATQLEQVARDKHRLSNEVSLLKEEVMDMKIKISENEKLQKMVDYIHERLEDLPVTDDEQVNSLLTQYEEVSYAGCEKFLSIITCFNDKIGQLMEEKKILLNERDVALVSLARAKAEAEVVKHEFEHDLRQTVSKLNVSSVLAEKLQTDFLAVSNKIHDSSEKAEKCAQMTEDLLSDFTKMEASLQEVTSENRDLVDRIMAFGSLTDELEDNKSEIHELKQKNLSLTELLQYNIDESDALSNELDNLKRTAEGLNDELSLLRDIRDKLDTEILNLNSQLKEKDDKLTRFDQLKNQLLHALEESIELLEMHGFLIAKDVVQTVIVKQYKLLVEELYSELEYFNKNFEEAAKKNLNNYAAENARLLSDLESLKSILEFTVALNQAQEHSNCSIATELEECQEKVSSLEAKLADDKRNKFETEIQDLVISNEELEIRSLVFRTTIDEMSAKIISHEERTGDCLQAYDKRKFKGSSFASQESLRVAFIKEEYETKLEEVCHQLSISEKHGEEMLLKLQDVLDDLERRKKREACQSKRNEQLMLKIGELETELKSVLFDNRENLAAYEQLKAELDCAVMSLDCCKEENYQLILSLQECNDYNRKLTNEVELLKEQLQNLKESTIRSENNKFGSHIVIDNRHRSSHVGNLVESSFISSMACCTEEALEEGNFTNFSDDQANHLTYTKILKSEISPQETQVFSLCYVVDEVIIKLIVPQIYIHAL
ncbi:hypothetical protein RND81_02G072900 [Saponaria officinalis]|uniref:C2 NT-type domain-containing protein n=1 Tax=Saponaria officinalis TaxID=3572 RepID=A0AAW1MS84_SAPOF